MKVEALFDGLTVRLIDVKLKTFGDKVAEVEVGTANETQPKQESNALIETLAARLAEIDVETHDTTLAEVDFMSVVNTLANRISTKKGRDTCRQTGRCKGQDANQHTA